MQQYVNQSQLMDLSGVGHFHDYQALLEYERTGQWPCVGTEIEEECAGLDPISRAIRDAEWEIESLKEFKNHVDGRKHTWNDNGFCDYCGWDGNA